MNEKYNILKSLFAYNKTLQITDYQGNNRVVIDQDGVTEQVNHYYPYGGIFGEGVSSSVQPYKFGGKELDRMNGLDWSDFGARMLDSPSGLWGSIDPMAEKYYAIKNIFALKSKEIKDTILVCVVKRFSADDNKKRIVELKNRFHIHFFCPKFYRAAIISNLMLYF